MKINQIRPQETDFTEVLTHIAHAPELLHYYGKLPEKGVKTVGIVGSRHATRYGIEVAKKIAFELTKRGVVVISGLAFGIDAAAHTGAVEAGGPTVAILGTEIEKVYPRANQALADKIIETGGAIMSEYQRGDLYDTRWSFLMRNRLISGLSDAVVIVEAAIKSGSLNTAAHALSQGKQVFAVPGNITNSFSQGCNKLIKQGAEPVTGVGDVVDFFFPPEKKQRKKKEGQLLIFGDTEAETEVLRLIYEGVSDGDEIIEATGMDMGEFNQTVTMLEIKGRIKGVGMNQWVAI